MVMTLTNEEKKAEHFPNRVIPVPEVGFFDSSSFSTTTPLPAGDKTTIEALSRGFVETGVLDRPVEARAPQSMKDLNAMVEEAIALSKSEKELRPEAYDSERDDELGADLSSEEDWENPSLDGIDDYGRQVYRNETKGLPRNPL